MKRLWQHNSFLILTVLVGIILFIYKDIIFNGKILFPSNFLVSFYSPWSTEKIKGWETGIPHKPIGDDQIRIFYPERTFTNEMLQKKIIPLWNPFVFSGTPHLADFQSAVFYPLNIIYLFIPQTIAWSFLLIIQPFMAVIFMFLFLRLFRLEKAAILLGTIAFGFCGFMIVWSQENVVVGQAALWLPLALFGIEGFLTTGKKQYYLIAVLAHAFSFLAGFFQVTFYIFALTFFYGLFRTKNINPPDKYKKIVLLLSIYIFSLALSAIQLFPSFEGFLNSPRSITNIWYLFQAYLLPFTHALNIFVPDIFGNPGSYNFFGRGFYRETILYIGLIPAIFAIYTIFKAKRNFIIHFFIWSGISSFFLSINSPFTKWFFNLPLPLLPTFLPSRIFILTAFSLATLSAFGFSIWTKQKAEKTDKLINRLLFVILIILSLITFYALLMLLNYEDINYFKQFNDYFIREYSVIKKTDIIVMLKNLIIPFIMLFGLFILIKLKRFTHLAIDGIVILTLLGQIYFFNKYKIIGDPQFLYPQNSVISFIQSKTGLERFITFGQPIHENSSTYNHLYSIEGVNPIFPGRYGQLLFGVNNGGKITNDIPRVEARLSEIGESTKLYNDISRLRLLSLLSVKHILYFDNKNSVQDVKNKFPDEIFKPVWQKNNWYAFEYRKSFPRAFLANPYIENNPQKIMDLIFDPKFDLSGNVILEEKPSEEINMNQNTKQNSSVEIKTYEPRKIEISVTTSNPKMLFLSDNYYPGWKAYIDNKTTKIYRANYTFRSVLVPSGKHIIRLLYEPQSFKFGFYISFFSIILFLLITFFKVKIPGTDLQRK